MCCKSTFRCSSLARLRQLACSTTCAARFTDTLLFTGGFVSEITLARYLTHKIVHSGDLFSLEVTAFCRSVAVKYLFQA